MEICSIPKAVVLLIKKRRVKISTQRAFFPLAFVIDLISLLLYMATMII